MITWDKLTVLEYSGNNKREIERSNYIKYLAVDEKF